MNRIKYCSLILIIVTLSCDQQGDFVKKSDYKGVEGTIYQINGDCGNPDLDTGKHPDSLAIVEISYGGERIARELTGDNGQFRIPLEPGQYNMIIYPSGNIPDESLTDLKISDTKGIAIGRSYRNEFWPRELDIIFHGHVTIARIGEILQEKELESVWNSHHQDFHLYHVIVPIEVHVVEMQTSLEQEYDEVESSGVLYYECAAFHLISHAVMLSFGCQHIMVFTPNSAHRPLISRP